MWKTKDIYEDNIKTSPLEAGCQMDWSQLGSVTGLPIILLLTSSTCGRCLEIFKQLDGYSIPYSTPIILIHFHNPNELIFSSFCPFLSLSLTVD